MGDVGQRLPSQRTSEAFDRGPHLPRLRARVNRLVQVRPVHRKRQIFAPSDTQLKCDIVASMPLATFAQALSVDAAKMVRWRRAPPRRSTPRPAP